MYYLKPTLQTYAWGSRSFIQALIAQPQHEKIAELWLGAHPKAPAKVAEASLDALISQDPERWLGTEINRQYGKLPYLLKVLAADEPLSIQVHPTKAQAEQGFAREEALGLAMNDPSRSYKDANHKPELIMALTPFDALCGIRAYDQIIDIFSVCRLQSCFSAYADFALKPALSTFRVLYQEILSAEVSGLSARILKLSASGTWQAEIKAAQSLISYYPTDAFVIAPLIMNLMHLAPHDAMYLDAGIPHAYLKGAGIELMASSDNVLRAGLSPKYIDKAEVLAIVELEPYIPKILRVSPQMNTLQYYPSPAKDFRLAVCDLKGELQLPQLHKPAILLCLQGSLRLSSHQGELILNQGQAAIILAEDEHISVANAAYFVIAEIG